RSPPARSAAILRGVLVDRLDETGEIQHLELAGDRRRACAQVRESEAVLRAQPGDVTVENTGYPGRDRSPAAGTGVVVVPAGAGDESAGSRVGSGSASSASASAVSRSVSFRTASTHAPNSTTGLKPAGGRIVAPGFWPARFRITHQRATTDLTSQTARPFEKSPSERPTYFWIVSASSTSRSSSSNSYTWPSYSIFSAVMRNSQPQGPRLRKAPGPGRLRAALAP